MVARHQLLSLSSPTFPIWLPQWHLLGFYFQVQLLLRDLLPSGHVLLHWVPALLQAGGYPAGSIASAPLCTEGRGLSRLRLSGFLTQGEILPKMLFFFFSSEGAALSAPGQQQSAALAVLASDSLLSQGLLPLQS